MSDASSRIDLVDARGKLVSVPAGEYDRALEQGFTLPNAAQQKEAAQRREYGQGLGNELAAGAEGAARGLTFGLSDLALTRTGLVDAEGMAQRKERNPFSSELGEGVGVVGGLLGGGVLGAGVKGAAAAGELASEGVGQGLARLGLQGTGLAGRALARGAEVGAGSAVEGALYGAGQGISEVSLGDPTDAAQRILAHATMGAILGGGLGSAAGAMGGLGTKALERFAQGSADLGDAEAGSLAENAVKQTPVRQRLQEYLSDVAGEQALDAAGLMKRDYKKLQRAAKPLAETASEDEHLVAADAHHELTLHDEAKRIMLEKNLVRAGDSLEDVSTRVQGAIDESHGRAKKFISDVDAQVSAGNGRGFDLNEYADALDAKLASPLRERPEKAAELEALEKRIASYRDLADKSGGEISYAKAEQLKRDFDSSFLSSGTTKQLAREARGMMNGQIEHGVKEVAESLDKDAFAAWKADKRTMEALLPVRKAGQDRMAAAQANRKISLTDYMTGLTGASIGAHAGPLGMAMGAAGAIGHKIIRERGNAVVSEMAARAAQALGAERGAQAVQLIAMERAAKGVTQQVKAAADGIVDSLAKAPHAVPALSVDRMHEIYLTPQEKSADNSKRNAYDNRLTELTNLANNPQLLQNRLEETMGDITRFAPRVSGEMHMIAAQAVQYLASKAPTNPYFDSPKQVRDAWQPSMTEIVSFERTLRAVHDPLGTVKEFEKGHVTAEAADALREVYPDIYNQLVTHIVPKIAEADSVPVQRRLELADMLGVTLDSLTSPDFTQSMQQMYANPPQKPAASARPGVSKNLRAKQSETPLQRALEGE